MKLEDKLLEDLKTECTNELYGAYVSKSIKSYLERVLGVTFVWSEDKQDWIKEIIK
tara:strand:+ start:368 stop:535 length:168 start_codon:yes stop_codon:yes gene_type:complete